MRLVDLDSGNQTCTIKIYNAEGVSKLFSGWWKDLGAVVTGFLLDPEAEDIYDTGPREFEVEILNWTGGEIVYADIWIHTPKGQDMLCRGAKTIGKIAEASNRYIFRRGTNVND